MRTYSFTLTAQIVRLVAGNPDLTATFAASVLVAHTNTVSVIMKRLADQKFLSRRDGKGPRGGHVYKVTAKGRRRAREGY